MSQEKFKTEKDYRESNFKLSYAVVNPTDNVVMQAGFVSKEDAIDFRDNAYCGYYNDCDVELVKTA